MNAPTQAAPGRAELLARMRELVVHLEDGDDAGFEARFASLVQAREQGLFVNVAKLTRELHDAVRELRFDEHLASLAGDAIPDACSRLDYVVQVTEEAAHKTLDLVEQTRALTGRIESSVSAMGRACELAQSQMQSPTQAFRAAPDLVSCVDDLGAQIVAANEALRGKLSQLAQAQEYQDLAGQVIKRVTLLVRSVERALIDLLRASGTHLGNRNAAADAPPNGLHGPAIAGVTPAAVSQDDADSLLAELGF